MRFCIRLHPPPGQFSIHPAELQLGQSTGGALCGLKDGVALQYLLHHAAGLRPVFRRAVGGHVTQGNAGQAESGQKGLPFLLAAPQGKREGLLPLHGFVQLVQSVPLHRVNLLLLHMADLVKELTQLRKQRQVIAVFHLSPPPSGAACGLQFPGGRAGNAPPGFGLAGTQFLGR